MLLQYQNEKAGIYIIITEKPDIILIYIIFATIKNYVYIFLNFTSLIYRTKFIIAGCKNHKNIQRQMLRTRMHTNICTILGKNR